MADLTTPQAALVRNRQEATRMMQTMGVERTRRLLEDAQKDLEKRIERNVKGLGDNAFTVVQMRTTLAQVRSTLTFVTYAMKNIIVETGVKSAKLSTEHVIDYLKKADKVFRGVGEQALSLREASMFSRAVEGVHSSILNRLVSTEGKTGILQRYSHGTIKHFEEILQRGLVTKKSLRDMREEIRDSSPFLKQKPAHWAERIVRTEIMGAHNRAGWHSIQAANDELGDMVKILAATFDDRTGSDSYSIHGMIRRPDEPFEWWEGAFQCPPNRPNDREIVVPHRISWEIPEYLLPKSDDEIEAVWKLEGRKGAPPERPVMTTVDLELFGRSHSQLNSASEEVDDE
jgi:hypothetical protein